MTFTDQQFEYLSQFRDKFVTAVTGDWVSTPSPLQLRTIAEYYRDVVKTTTPIRTNCSRCILRLMKDVGKLWLADEVERAKAAKVAARKKTSKKKNSNDTETTD